MQLTFFATDQNHHTVATLNASDFAVVDNDFIVRNFRSFRVAEYTRLDVAVLLDTSGSISPRFQDAVAELSDLISETSGMPDDSISVISFRGLRPAVMCQGNCHTPHAAELIRAISSGGPTPLFDSLNFAGESLGQTSDRHSRKIVILFSDGEDTISRSSSNEAIETLMANDVQVYSVNLNSTPSSRGTAFLQKLSAVTGGRSFLLHDGASAVVEAVLADFHASYQVSYRLPNPSDGFHTLRILPTKNLNLNFRCRQGYLYSTGR